MARKQPENTPVWTQAGGSSGSSIQEQSAEEQGAGVSGPSATQPRRKAAAPEGQGEGSGVCACVCVCGERERERETHAVCVAGLYLCTSQEWTLTQDFSGFSSPCFSQLRVPPLPCTSKSSGRPSGAGLLSGASGSLRQDRYLSLKLPPLLHNCLALPWASRPASWEMSAPTLSCGIELEHVADGLELWAVETTKQELPAPLFFLSLFPTSCLGSTEIQTEAPDCIPSSLSPAASCSILYWVLGWNGACSGFEFGFVATLYRPPFWNLRFLL